jgi:ABC transporter transmembrane region
MQEDKKSGQILDWVVLQRLFQFIKPYKTQFYLLVIAIMVSAALSPMMPLLIKRTIDVPVANKNYNGLAVMMAIMVGVLVLQSCVQFINTYLSGWLGQSIIKDIRVHWSACYSYHFGYRNPRRCFFRWHCCHSGRYFAINAHYWCDVLYRLAFVAH